MSLGARAACTVTGTDGPGLTVTAKTFTDIVTYSFDVAKNLFTMVDSANKVLRISIGAATTVTVVLSAAGGNHTVTIS